MNIDMDYLKKLVEILQQADPYNSKYSAWAFTLRNLEEKITKLSDKIRKEVGKF